MPNQYTNQPERSCTLDGCNSKHLAQGWCALHYQRWRRNGDPEWTPYFDFEHRLWSGIEKTDTCWLWTRSTNGKGYGQIQKGSQKFLVHRATFERLVGPVPDGLELDHLCRVRLCCNPEHLEPVTRKENILRGESPTALNARKTHCKNGHPFDEKNTRTDGRGYRVCRACERKRDQRRSRK